MKVHTTRNWNQPGKCSSPLTRGYGYGVHSNEEGKAAIYDLDPKEYKKHVADEKLFVVKAMRSKKARFVVDSRLVLLPGIILQTTR